MVLIVAVVAACVVGGCTDMQQWRIDSWLLDPDPKTVVNWGGCHEGRSKAEVHSEDEAQVVIHLTVSGDHLGDCLGSG